MISVSPFSQIRNFICRRHNVIQLIGYEGANVALLFQQGVTPDRTALPETFAAIFFMAGSLAICLFDPVKRPWALMWGGFSLALGGAMIVAAGYPLTGGAVALASLETARGGMAVIAPRLADETLATRLLSWVLQPYGLLVERTVGRAKHIGPMLKDRPFLIGALIKLPLRVEFIAKNMLAGDMVGTGVGLAWMILGDGGLALNDNGLKRRVMVAERSEGHDAGLSNQIGERASLSVATSSSG